MDDDSLTSLATETRQSDVWLTNDSSDLTENDIKVEESLRLNDEVEDLPRIVDDAFLIAPQSSPVQLHAKTGSPHLGRQKTVDVENINGTVGVVGLHNEGNTCFMNAGLQCLFANPWLIKHFLNETSHDDDKNKLVATFGCLLEKVWSGRYSVLTAAELKESFAELHSQFRDFRQHDSQEFLALLLDSLHELIIKYKKTVSANDISPDSLSSPSTITEDSHSVGSNMQFSKSICTYVSNSVSSPSDLTSDADTVCGSGLVSESGSPPSVQTVDTVLQCDDLAQGVITLAVASQTLDNNDCIHLKSSDHVPCSRNTLENSDLLEGTASICDPVIYETADVECSSRNMNKEASSERLRSQLQLQINCKNFNSSNKKCKSLKVSDESQGEAALISPRPLTKKLRLDMSINKETPEAVDNVFDSSQSFWHASSEEGEAKRLPSIEDLCMKDTKTKNVNVAIDEEDIGDGIAIDSEKFRKQENVSVAQQLEKIEYLQELLDYDTAKAAEYKALKETNLLANVKSKFSDCDKEASACQVEFSSDMEPTASCSSGDSTMANNAKLWKGGEEKNILWETRVKMNTCRNPVRELAAEAVDNREQIILNNQRLIASSEVSGFCLNNRRHLDLNNATTNVNGDGDTCLQQAECTWNTYLHNNRTVISETFHGLFKSTVTCSECGHVSVTFEPFMYLSVPLPRALERQLEVTFVPYGFSFNAIKCMVNVLIQDTVLQLKTEVCRVLECSTEIVIAETFKNHISKILDDDMLIKNINDDTRQLFALEVVSNNKERGLDELFIMAENLSHDYNFDNKQNYVTSACSSQTNCSEYNKTKDQLCNSSFDSFSGHGYNVLESDPSSWQNNCHGTNSECTNLSGATQKTLETETIMQRDDSALNIAEVAQASGDAFSDMKASQQPYGCGDWATCTICLEVLRTIELKIHPRCKALICYNCEETAYSVYGNDGFKCPVCMQSLNPDELIALDCELADKPLVKMLPVPLVFRHEISDNELEVFGFPHVVHVPNVLNGIQLYAAVEGVVKGLGNNFSLFLTGGQGLHCSRCLYTKHCSGCIIIQDASELYLTTSDTLAIHFTYLSSAQMDLLTLATDHPSLHQHRQRKVLTLGECLNSFSESETLDEQNHWFCPTCRKNCTAKKTLTVWKYPPTLIIYLKRFIYHGLSSTKIETPVEFPIENLDLQDYMSGPVTTNCNQLLYNLQSCVCHFGSGTNYGHYTAYTKQPLSGVWSYHNDETVYDRDPGESDNCSIYILFYQRKGESSNFKLPSNTSNLTTMRTCSSWPLFPMASEPTSSESQYQLANNTDAASLQLDFCDFDVD